MNKLNKILVLSLLILIPSCHLYKLEHQLDSENAEFLSKVRYIITSKERKIFLQLSDSEKEKFREEFWKSRDPDSYTEENEFKEKSNENYRIEVPFLLEENAARLQQEKNLLHVHIKNRTGDEELKKSFRFRIKV